MSRSARNHAFKAPCQSRRTSSRHAMVAPSPTNCHASTVRVSAHCCCCSPPLAARARVAAVVRPTPVPPCSWEMRSSGRVQRPPATRCDRRVCARARERGVSRGTRRRRLRRSCSGQTGGPAGESEKWQMEGGQSVFAIGSPILYTTVLLHRPTNTHMAKRIVITCARGLRWYTVKPRLICIQLSTSTVTPSKMCTTRAPGRVEPWAGDRGNL
jgi:hypothetical protein